MDILNSSGKKIGEIEIQKEQIIINNYGKPLFIIKEPEVIEKILNKDESIFPYLFTEYTLLIGEIATLFNQCYATTRRHLQNMNLNTNSHDGRRNSSYGKTFTEERRKNIGESLKGKKPHVYERTPEIKKKISDGLKKYYSEHEVSQETREKLSQAWADGKYNKSAMGRGYNGYFQSIKNNKRFYFRSLLELKFLILLEEDEEITKYEIEPFQIKLSDNHHYTPDVLINDSILIELKPYNHLNWEDPSRWEEEIQGAENYCQQNNLIFRVIYDIDIDFESRRYKNYLLDNPQILKQYNVEFIHELKRS